MVEGGGLENRCAARHRGFESPLLRESRQKVGNTPLSGESFTARNRGIRNGAPADQREEKGAWMMPHRRMAVHKIIPIGKRPVGTYAPGRGRRRVGVSKQEVCERRPNPPCSEKPGKSQKITRFWWFCKSQESGDSKRSVPEVMSRREPWPAMRCSIIIKTVLTGCFLGARARQPEGCLHSERAVTFNGASSCWFFWNNSPYWSGARAAESGSLLRSCAPKGYRGFESPLLRCSKSFGFWAWEFCYAKLHVSI